MSSFKGHEVGNIDLMNMYHHSFALYYHCTLKQPGLEMQHFVMSQTSLAPPHPIWSHLRAQSGPYLQDACMFAGNKYSVFL